MKQTITIVLILISSFGVLSQEVNFISSDIKSAFAQARSQNKLLFVEIYSNSCHHCAEMEPNFKDKSVANFYNQNFVSYKLEVTSGDVQAFLNPRKLFAPSLPMFLYFDGNENVVHFAMSNPKPDEVVKHGQTAKNTTARASNYKSRYAAGERSSEFLTELAMYCRVISDVELNVKVMEEYARKMPASKYADKNNWLVIQKLVLDVDNPLGKYFIDHYQEFLKKYDPKEVKPVAENLVMSSLYSPRGAKYDAAKIQQIRKQLIQIGVPAASANARTMLPEVNYYFANKQTAKAVVRTEDYLNNSKAQLADYQYLIKLFNQKATDKTYTTALTKWVNKALTMTIPNSPEAIELKQELKKVKK
jgi:thiol-disulfide isomerase/thioredoxin